MQSFVDRLAQHPLLASMVAHRRSLAAEVAEHGDPARPLPERLQGALETLGIERLYRHQAEGLDRARAGANVLAVTPTASGKTLLFALCALESVVEDPGSRALFLYPTKALAQDQLGALRQLAGGMGALNPPRFEIYDGDTPQERRRRIKADPPHVLLTNPDMLHAGLLAHHADWETLFRRLRWIVLDELHVYRGIFGAHVHHILARLQRIARHYGADPQFVAASATVGNPAEFASRLVGRPFEVVSASGAERAPLEAVFLNPAGVSPYTVAVRVVAEAVSAGLKTIAFAKARRVTELLHAWLVRHDPALERKIAPYRAGYRPEERRAIEARLFGGELSAVLSTSALELGIDVGRLDVCVLVGYPGSLITSWQRIGRVGRRGRPGLVVLIALPDALDQYVIRHPELFFGRQFEKAVLDPWNPLVSGRHLVCAAAEHPLELDELETGDGRGREVADRMTGEGRLVRDAEGSRWFSFRRNPHRDVSPRSAGQPFQIAIRAKGRERALGTIDGLRVYHECHPGAIYLHGGQSFQVTDLDEDRRRVLVEPVQADHYTVVMGEKETAILERLDRGRVHGLPVGLGRLRVTVRVRGYQKRRLFGGETISTHPLDVPPIVYETVGFWIELPPGLPAVATERELHFMGGIHAAEHAIIGLFPLLAIADRGDVGGISYTGHPQLGVPAIFIYDGVPGGAGLAEQGFRDLGDLARRTLDHVESCRCEDGCPGCIQSPNCGNGNKPLDKTAARLVLGLLCGRVGLDELGIEARPSPDRLPEAPALDAPAPSAPLETGRRHGIRRAGNIAPDEIDRAVSVAPDETHPQRARSVLVFDLETQRSAEEVGGWGNTDRMGLALAVTYDDRDGNYRTYFESDVQRLLLDLVTADLVIGFNIDRFDLVVLSGYVDWEMSRIRTFDLLGEIRERLGFRLSLNHLAQANLSEGKSADGLQSLRWWRDGRRDLVEQYCRKDVEVTRRLFELGRDRGYLLYRDHSDRVVRLPVDWGASAAVEQGG